MHVWPLRLGEPVHIPFEHVGTGLAVKKVGLAQMLVGVVTVNVPE